MFVLKYITCEEFQISYVFAVNKKSPENDIEDHSMI